MKYLTLPILHKASARLEKEADLKAVDLLFQMGYKSTIEEHLHYLQGLIKQDHGNWTDGGRPSIAQEYRYIKDYFASLQRAEHLYNKPLTDILT